MQWWFQASDDPCSTSRMLYHEPRPLARSQDQVRVYLHTCTCRIFLLSPAPAGCDVHIYDVVDPATVLGGLILTNGVTSASFYLMVEIIFIFDTNYFLRDEGGTTDQIDNYPLRPAISALSRMIPSPTTVAGSRGSARNWRIRSKWFVA
ncbi:hypothetical protein DFP73DRAFT_523070 [Morchella snyderi]|nr:hypothetical protein DFP73DRAFT_523070 [Morchella snyderi]